MFDKFLSVEFIAYDTARRRRKHHRKAFALHAEIYIALYHAEFFIALVLGIGHVALNSVEPRINVGLRFSLVEDGLTEGDFMTARRPQLIFFQMERSRQRIFALTEIGQRNFNVFSFAGQNMRRVHLPTINLFAVYQQSNFQIVVGNVAEQRFILNADFIFLRLQREVLVIEFHVLQLRSFAAVGKKNSIAAEIVIGRTVAEVAAVKQRLFFGRINCLVNEIPNETALIKFVLFRQARVVVHSAVGVAH